MDLTVEDFKQLLLDLYLAQRENRMLREALVAVKTAEPVKAEEPNA